MKIWRFSKITLPLVLLLACGSGGGTNNPPPPVAHGFSYQDPVSGWRFVRNSNQISDTLTLDLAPSQSAKPIRGLYFSANLDPQCTFSVEILGAPAGAITRARVDGQLLEAGIAIPGGVTLSPSAPALRVTVKANGIGSRPVTFQPVHLSVVYSDGSGVIEEPCAIGTILHN